MNIGVNPNAGTGYMGLSPFDIVGDCRCDNPRDFEPIRSALKRPKRVPRAPVLPTAKCKLGHDLISHIEYVEVAADDPR